MNINFKAHNKCNKKKNISQGLKIERAHKDDDDGGAPIILSSLDVIIMKELVQSGY